MLVNWLFLFHSSLHLLQLQTSFLWWMQQHTIFSPAFQSQNHKKAWNVELSSRERFTSQRTLDRVFKLWCWPIRGNASFHQAQPYHWWGYRKEKSIQLPEGSKAPDYVAPLHSPWTACALLNPSSFTLCALCIICMCYLAALAWSDSIPCHEAPVAWPWVSASCVAWAQSNESLISWGQASGLSPG